MVRPTTRLADDAALPLLQQDRVVGSWRCGDTLEKASGKESVRGRQQARYAFGAVESVCIWRRSDDCILGGRSGEEEGG